MARRLLIAVGVGSAYLGYRPYVRKLRQQVVALSREETFAVARMVSTNLQVLTASEEDLRVSVKILKRAKEMGWKPPGRADG